MPQEHPLWREGLLHSLEIPDQQYNWIRPGVAFRIHVARSDDGGYTTIFKAYTDQILSSPVRVSVFVCVVCH